MSFNPFSFYQHIIMGRLLGPRWQITYQLIHWYRITSSPYTDRKWCYKVAIIYFPILNPEYYDWQVIQSHIRNVSLYIFFFPNEANRGTAADFATYMGLSYIDRHHLYCLYVEDCKQFYMHYMCILALNNINIIFHIDVTLPLCII